MNGDLNAYLAECRALVLDEIRSLVPSDPLLGEVLYDRMLDYPLRAAKGLRPALAIATCRALGGRLESALPTAAVLELYHNAFLIHDDVEDGSELRRGEPTLHRTWGVPIAVNVGDAMLALALQPLLDNTRLVGVGPALRVLQVIAEMARETAEGQALELDRTRRGDWMGDDAAYEHMVHKKTSWYTFVAPVMLGSILAGASTAQVQALRAYASPLGVAFQVIDDVLDLVGKEASTGKAPEGDLWEGKHTLVMMHALRCCRPDERRHAHEVLRRPRAAKTDADVRFLRGLVDRLGSIPYARRFALERAGRARASLRGAECWLPPSVHRGFLEGLVDFTIRRSA